jgi:hypothetical protein
LNFLNRKNGQKIPLKNLLKSSLFFNHRQVHPLGGVGMKIRGFLIKIWFDVKMIDLTKNIKNYLFKN